ncbi:IclR family transcriptional regulator [Ethanoligenens sp.]|uniref:IclR family transcriptional regulator n=1 Tax=Ethanoligenens sp. TaxID=2099655 RepID=UPI0039EAC188
MAQLQTLSKALDILNTLGKSDFLSIEEIATLLCLPESTVYRLMNTLEAKGFVERYSHKQYGLGSNLINLTRTLYDKWDRELTTISLPYMQEVCGATKETTLLSIRAGLHSKCIKSVSSSYIIRFVAEDNRLLKLHIGASSRAILAYEDPKIINMVKDTLESPAEQEALENYLQQTRQNGYSITSNQFDVGAVGIAVPIFNMFGKIYASLAIVGPESRVRPDCYETYISIMKRCGTRITEALRET